MTLIASKGDIVTCENGHRLFQVVEEMSTERGALRASAMKSIHPGMENPIPGRRIGDPPCPECGGAWGSRCGLHFDNGWRPKGGGK